MAAHGLAPERDTAAPLRGSGSAAEFCRALPRHDPITAQKLLCEALASLVARRDADDGRLDALRVLEQHAQLLGARLLALYAEGDAQLRSLDRRYFIAAQRLSRAFAEACERVLVDFGSTAGASARASAAAIAARLLQHRQAELLLRLFRYKKRNSEQWGALHATYRQARARGLVEDDPPDAPAGENGALGPTVEQAFIQALLVGAMGTGQFSPRELLWASRWFVRWRDLLALRSGAAGDAVRGRRDGFVVDLDGGEGLRRVGPGEGDALLHLDTTPLMGAIDRELAALAGAAAGARATGAAQNPDAVAALLSRLRVLFAPVPVHIKRRGERRPVALTVQAISGLPHIVQALREEVRRQPGRAAAPGGRVEDVTIAPTSGHTRMSASPLDAPGLGPLSIATICGVVPQAWQVKDRSDSGCRIRGQTADLNGHIPGSLLAIREGDGAPWTVAVVRRLRRLMVDHVEISVEHIGRTPRFVKMVTVDGGPGVAADAPDARPRCFGALYLPASAEHPTMPIKTLVLPGGAFTTGSTVTLLTSAATFTLRLNKPLEQQSDFVWTSFSVIDKVNASPLRGLRGGA